MGRENTPRAWSWTTTASAPAGRPSARRTLWDRRLCTGRTAEIWWVSPPRGRSVIPPVRLPKTWRRPGRGPLPFLWGPEPSPTPWPWIPCAWGKNTRSRTSSGSTSIRAHPSTREKTGRRRFPSRRASRGPPWAGPSPRRPWSGARGF